ncbi:hypothetical protein SEPCBS119000_004613 [Sporothrix epigloea]|uniref:ferric-chelate reductase (NADPH) n=1 Tax=Sporothrix epigloea TaxID=1892477 RepID=A0ABP0DT42_9PEZI
MASSTDEPAPLARRIYIPLTATSPPGLIEADTVDPWIKSGKYGLALTYFAAALTASVFLVRLWHYWQDKIRQAIYKQEVEKYYKHLYQADTIWDAQLGTAPNVVATAPANDGQTSATACTTNSASSHHFFPSEIKAEAAFRPRAHMSSITAVNDTLALFRWIFYRPIPDLVVLRWRFTFSSLAVLACGCAALAFTALYCFLPQPLYWQSIRYGSPPLAIRAGMMSVALTPWIIATSTKTNILSFITGIGPERLNVLHRWAGYLCLFLSLVHALPFYIQPVWDDGGMAVFQSMFPGSMIVYGTGIACLVPLLWLCVASLPIVRRIAYEAFVLLHIPVGLLYVGLLFWHTKNYLGSWTYLYTTLGIFFGCQVVRLRNLNWTRPWRVSFLVGDEAAITIMSENAIKITIPTQMRWKPGQYVYLRMPGISLWESHPFTVSSLCSEDFESDYGEAYRDCVLVFRPYGGFTRRVLETAMDKGPFHTYRAFLDGPYGGMRRELSAFDTCILIAGGSGITSLMSQLLNLIKRMRDGKAITKKIVVVWSLKRLQVMDWFREELRICRESAPPESVTCKFFVTLPAHASNQHGHYLGSPSGPGAGENAASTPHQTRAPRPLSNQFHDRLDGFIAGMASKRSSALIDAEVQNDPLREGELRAENLDRITALPQQKYLQPYSIPRPPPNPPAAGRMALPLDPSVFQPVCALSENARKNDNTPDDSQGQDSKVAEDGDHTGMYPPELAHLRMGAGSVERRPLGAVGGIRPTSMFRSPLAGLKIVVPESPSPCQDSPGHHASSAHQIDGGWSVEYGRPDLEYMLRKWATGRPNGRGILGRRTAVFVCGPAGMRVGVANAVARLQAEIWGDEMLEEIFLHTENYAL